MQKIQTRHKLFVSTRNLILAKSKFCHSDLRYSHCYQLIKLCLSSKVFQLIIIICTDLFRMQGKKSCCVTHCATTKWWNPSSSRPTACRHPHNVSGKWKFCWERDKKSLPSPFSSPYQSTALTTPRLPAPDTYQLKTALVKHYTSSGGSYWQWQTHFYFAVIYMHATD